VSASLVTPTAAGIYLSAMGKSFISINSRLSLIEENVTALPAIVSEALIDALSSISPGFRVDVYAPSNPVFPKEICGIENGRTVGMRADLDPLLQYLVFHLSERLRASIDYSELEAIRARVRQLEEDLGYRKKIAEKLMEDYKK
jgi:hypothetical protein